jgi:hypothetical protein
MCFVDVRIRRPPFLEITDPLAGVKDFMLAKATHDAAVRRWPKARIRLWKEARIVEDSGDPA